MDLEKLDATKQFCCDVLSRWKRPAVLWSGGKDSMVILHILRDIHGPLPVICWREPWLPEKQTFANRMIKEWGLEVWDWHPQAVALSKGNGRIDVLNYYSWSMQAGPSLILCRGIEKTALPGETLLCGKDTFLTRPMGHTPIPWDMAFHGHKSVDVDPLTGAMPLETDIVDIPGATACCFPLRNWTDDDVFEYTELFGVPYDQKRYRRNVLGWEVLPYQSENPDYYPACFKCCDPDEGEFVDCPKLKMRINNISNSVAYRSPKMPYCNLRNSS